MGFSLAPLGRKIEDILGGKAVSGQKAQPSNTAQIINNVAPAAPQSTRTFSQNFKSDPFVGVVKTVGSGIAQPYNYLSRGIAETAAYNTPDQVAARQAQANLQDSQTQNIQRASVRLRDPNVSQAEKARWQVFLANNQKDMGDTFNAANTRTNEVMANTSPLKGAMSVGSIGLDIATLGVGTAGAQAAKEAGKQALITGGKTAARKAVAKEVAKQAGINAAIAAPSGALSVGIDKGKDATVGDYLAGAGTAAAIGAAIPVASYGVSRGAEKVAKVLGKDKVKFAVPGETPQVPGATAEVPQFTKNKVTLKTTEAPKSNVAQSPSTVENIAADLQAAQAAQEARIMNPTGLDKVRAFGRDISSKIYNPFSEAERFNAVVSKSLGRSSKDVLASGDLAHNLDVVGNSGTVAGQISKNTGLEKVVGKYKPGSQEESSFITYMAMKRDINTRAKKGVKILPYETQQLKDAVADYELKNPQAAGDMGVVNNHFKVILGNARKDGTITEQAYKAALASEDYYAPVARVMGSEDVLRPTINANVRGGLSHQTALQTLTGSDKPINTTWDAIVGATEKTTKENARNRVFGILYNAADKNLADKMVKMGMTKEQSKALFDLKDTISQLQDMAQKTGKTVRSTSKKVRVESKKATAFNNKVQDSAIKKMAESMGVTDPDGAAALLSLNRKQQSQLTEWLSTGMTDTQISRGNKLNAQAQESYYKLMQLRAQAEGLHNQTKLAKGATRELNIVKNEKTGRQVINGFVDGYPVWVETTPNMAKMLQGLEPQQLDHVTKALSSVQHVWRTFWTGAFNPVFAAKSKLFYDPAMMTLNQSGARNQLRLSAWGGALGDNFGDADGFFTKLKMHGVAPVTGSRIVGDTKQTAELMASHADIQSRLEYLAKHPGEALQAMDLVGGKLAHSSRMQVARAEYAKAKAAKLSEEDALANAARAYNNVLPNYGRTSKLLKALDAWIPYANAGIAGTRAMTDAMKRDPIGWGVKAGGFGAALAAVGVYALSDDKTKEFYQDMYDSGKQSIVQNNLVFALPGASKNPDTGEWTGIVKIPIPPEFRAPNALIEQQNFKNAGGDTNGYDPTLGAMSTIASGGTLNIGRSGGVNAELNPGLSAVTELATNKQNMGMGDSYAYGDNQYLPRNEQVNKDTSQLAISGANAFNKLPVGDISPVALDAQLNSLGFGGKVVRSVGSSMTKNENTTPEQLPGTDWKKSTVGIVSADGTKGMTDAKWHFKNQDTVISGLKTETLRNQFNLLNTKNDSPGDSQAKSQLLYESLQSDGKLWDAQKKQNELDAQKGGLSNPLFSLTPEQARAVTLYRGNARMNAAKQSYAKDGSSLFESLGLDNKWYQDFKQAEGVYYDKIAAKTKADPNAASLATAAKTYSGTQYTETSPVMQSKLDQYFAYPAKSAERKAYLKANPDIVEYWNQQNGLANEERLAMGLDLLGTDTASSGYSKYSSGSGGSSSSNPYKYAVSLNAGGNPVKPSTSTKKVTLKGTVAYGGTSKPSVSIKKSKV